MNNSKRRIALFAILTAFVAIVVVTRPWSTRRAVAPQPTPAIVGAKTTNVRPEPKTVQVMEPAIVASAPKVQDVIQASGATAVYSTRFTDLADMYKGKLGISAEQLSKIQNAYNDNIRKRLALEAELATATQIDETKTVIKIPAYVDKGIEAEFYKQLDLIVGEKVSAQVELLFGAELRSENGGFGYRPQEMVVTTLGPDHWRISHTYKVSDGPSITSVDTVQRNQLDKYRVIAPLFFPHLKS